MEIFVPGDLYYHGDEIRIKSRLADYGISDGHIGLLTFDSSRACAASRLLIERELDKRGLLYSSKSQLIEGFLRGERELFASLCITDPSPMNVFVPSYPSDWHTCGLWTDFRYGYEEIRVQIWLRRIWQECQLLGQNVKRIDDVGMFLIKQMHFLGIASWDRQKKEIDMIPYIVTDVT